MVNISILFGVRNNNSFMIIYKYVCVYNGVNYFLVSAPKNHISMAEVGVEVLNELDLEQIINYEPGYGWIPNRFGPPPGIAKSKKNKN